MTENEIYMYDDGYHTAMKIIGAQIDLLQEKYKSDVSLIDLKLMINQFRHARDDIDNMATRVLQKVENK